MDKETKTQTHVNDDKGLQNVQKTETTTVENNPQPQSEPSLEEVMSIISKVGNEHLIQLAPVKELIESARKQEKDKLYKTLEQREREAKELEAKLKEANKAIEEFQQQNLTFEERIQLEIQKVKEEQQALVEQLRREKEEAEKQARQKHLEAYKAAKLREAGEEIIPELVGGNSEEEIDRSIELAKAKYQEIAQKFAAQAKQQQQQEFKQTFSTKAPSSSQIQPLTAEEIRRMTPEEYAKNRERILEAYRLGLIQ